MKDPRKVWVSSSSGTVTVELEEGEDVFTVLNETRGPVGRCRRSMTAIRDSNQKLMKERKLPLWIGPPDRILLKPIDEETKNAKADTQWSHRHNVVGVPQIIDVYLGFMDEEVNARLAMLIAIEQAKPVKSQRPVLLIERGKVEPGKLLLEWSLGNYHMGLKSITNVSPGGQKVYPMEQIESWTGRWPKKKTKKSKSVTVSPKGDKAKEEASSGENETAPPPSPESALAEFMAMSMEQDLAEDLDWLARGMKVKRYIDVIKLIQHQITYQEGGKKAKPKLDLPKVGAKQLSADPWMSVVRFKGGNDARAPIVVIRTPEMGLQPSLMCPYIAFLFKALSGMAGALAGAEAQRLTGVGKGEMYTDRAQPKKWDVWEWPLRVSEFGAQGSTSELRKYRPGTTVTVVASLFVGVEVSSSVTVSAKEKLGPRKRKQRKFAFPASEDKTMAAPGWVQTKCKDQEPVPIRPLPDEFERVKIDESAAKVWAVISLCTPAGVYDFLRHDIDPKGEMKSDLVRFEKARDLAKRLFHADDPKPDDPEVALMGATPDSRSPFHELEKDLLNGVTSLKEAIARIRKKYAKRFFCKDSKREGVVTLTVSYFAGEEDKNAADKLGIAGVNMEDYHVLRVLHSAMCEGQTEDSDYPLILGWRVDRINCDPKSIDDTVKDHFQKWIEDEGTLSLKDYEAVIDWGLNGLRGEVPERLRWTLVDKIAKEGTDTVTVEGRRVLEKHLYSTSWNQDAYHVPNPFCIEIATDFLAELAKIKPWKSEPGGISGINALILATSAKKRLTKKSEPQPRASIRKETKRKIKARMKKDLATLRSVQTRVKGRASAFKGELTDERYEEWLCKEIKRSSLKADWYSIITYIRAQAKALPTAKNRGDAVKMLMETLCEYCDFRVQTRSDRLKTWLRPGKWGSPAAPITATTLQGLRKNEFADADIDRALYKSCNMMALQQMAHYFLWEGEKENPIPMKSIPKAKSVGGVN